MVLKKVYISTANATIDKLLLSMFKHDDLLIPELVLPAKLFDKIHSDPPCLILLLENFAICHTIKSDEITSSIPVISVLFNTEVEEDNTKNDLSADYTWTVGGDIRSLMGLVREYIPKEKKRILIADDEDVIHDVIKRILGNELYEFEDSYNGSEAIEMVSIFKPDLVITDITMPVFDGFKVCKVIKDNPKTAEIPVMIVSAHTDESIIKKGFEAGADEYITKPFPLEELISKVEFLFTEPLRKRNERILIVDDNHTILSILKNGIQQQGFTVLTATNGEDGLQIARHEHPDIIVSDLEMPKMNGFELCKHLKDLPDTKGIPFIALTAKDSKGARGLGKRVGVDAYLSKPFTIEKVVVIIERFLAERSVMMELEREMMIATIGSLAKALDERDKYTRFHSENVARYSVKIASALNMSKSEIEEIRLSAILHDIGKIGIRDAILFKPGELTEEEYMIIQQHPAKGAAILKPIPSLKDIIPYILYHHARYDGTGLQHSPKGDKIPLGARIIAVADTYDALTTDRPYRKLMSKEDSIELIKNLAGTQLCPFVVKKFLEIIDLGLAQK